MQLLCIDGKDVYAVAKSENPTKNNYAAYTTNSKNEEGWCMRPLFEKTITQNLVISLGCKIQSNKVTRESFQILINRYLLFYYLFLDKVAAFVSPLQAFLAS